MEVSFGDLRNMLIDMMLSCGSRLLLVCVLFPVSAVPVLAEDEGNGIFHPTYSELSGYISGETFLFAEEGLSGRSDRIIFSFAIEPEYYLEYGRNDSITFRPFLRVDSLDSNRTHGDLRELLFQTTYSDWYISVGMGKVFWGVTESKHLVDIVNQTDLVESLTGEAKLGQPMIQLSGDFGLGFMDLFVMPYFRERAFPSRTGRFRNSTLVDAEKSVYESKAEEFHPDLAARYSVNWGNWDVGLAQFYGTSREPSLTLGVNKEGATVFVPNYELILQSSADIQYTSGVWLWKFEGVFRAGQRNTLGSKQNYYSWVGGLEYNIYNVASTNSDLGLLAEYMRDSRLNSALDPLHHDVFFGLRLGLNDEYDSQALVGMVQDVGASTRQFLLEASRRISDGFKATVEGQIFSSVNGADPLQALKDDDFLRIEFAYYY